MSMTYELNKESGLVEVHLDRAPSIDDYQTSLPKIIKATQANNISKWLIVLDFREPQESEQALRFTESAFIELRKYISKIAVVCGPEANSRVREVLTPIETMEKPVGIFSSAEDAREWLVD